MITIELTDAEAIHLLGCVEAPHPEPHEVAMVRCDCGHLCPAAVVLSASLGTACPDCYDRLSD